MKKNYQLQANAIIFSALMIFMTSCKDENQMDRPNTVRGDERNVRIWAGQGNTLYTLEDKRYEGQDFTEIIQMTVVDELDMGGPAINEPYVQGSNVYFTKYDGTFIRKEIIPNSLNPGSNDFTRSLGVETQNPVILFNFELVAFAQNDSIIAFNEYEESWTAVGNTTGMPNPCLLGRGFPYEGPLIFANGDGILKYMSPTDSIIGNSYVFNEELGAIRSNPMRIVNQEGTNFDLVAGSEDGRMYCLDGMTNDIIWYFESGSPIFSSPEINHWVEVTIDDGPPFQTIFFGNDGGQVHALSGYNGNPLWTFNVGAAVRSSPEFQIMGPNLLDGEGIVYFGSDNGNMYALDSFTGEPIWQVDLQSGPIRTSPVAIENVPIGLGISTVTVYVNTENGVYGLDGESGSVRSFIALEGVAGSSPVIAEQYEGELYYGGRHPSNIGQW